MKYGYVRLVRLQGTGTMLDRPRKPFELRLVAMIRESRAMMHLSGICVPVMLAFSIMASSLFVVESRISSLLAVETIILKISRQQLSRLLIRCALDVSRLSRWILSVPAETMLPWLLSYVKLQMQR